MESMELLDRMDQVRRRVKVTYEAAKDALEDNNYNVVEAIMELEKEHGQAALEFSRKTRDRVLEPSVILRRRGKDLLQVPALAAAGAVLIGLIKPKLLLVSFTALLVSGTDLTVSWGDGQAVSLFEGFRKKSKKAVVDVADLKEKFDDRYHDLKDRGFTKEQRKAGLNYFTIKL